MLRLRLAIRGAVQGVGFRPFVYRLATDLWLSGWVNNSPQGVFLEVEGEPAALSQFLLRVDKERPPRSSIQSLECNWLDPVGYTQFEIRPSEVGGAKTALVLPDIATCAECLREVFDPADRRYSYPFTNCTNCGPRFSIIEALPYDRANTSMKNFTMCPQCQAEYDDARNRRFHAQPNACPVCGPRLELWGASGEIIGSTGRSLSVLQQAADAIRNGRIVAVKGLGGFHLITTAHDSAAVRRLRERKHREEKPFALMFPSLDSIREVCEVSPLEERLLRSAEAPIVLLRRHATARAQRAVCPEVAPGNPYFGAMLPYTPLHHLLLSLVRFPVVATSGNLSDEPICTDEREALQRLSGVADLFLVHNRPIVRHVDDSIARVVCDREQVLRRARGFAPLPITLPNAVSGVRRVLAVGAHLKNTVALSVGSEVFISQHIGDLEAEAAYDAFRRVIADFEKLYETRPEIIAADSHPDYLSTQFATSVARASSPAVSAGVPARSSSADAAVELVQRNGLLVSVQHHLAHTLSCMAENELDPAVLGVSWDGTGYGADATIWGGEFFDCEHRGRETNENVCDRTRPLEPAPSIPEFPKHQGADSPRPFEGRGGGGEGSLSPIHAGAPVGAAGSAFRRVAHLRQFRLPGGEQAIKEPRRCALGLLYELYGDAAFARLELPPLRAFSANELASLKTMLQRGLNSPLTSSVGRLFDAVASLAGLRQQTRFEGQAAMELEFALTAAEAESAYQFAITGPEATSPSAGVPLILDWAPLVESVLSDLHSGASVGQISARFHNGLIEAIVTVARRVGHAQVCLSGGCFQNRYLTERAICRLRAEGFRPYWQQRVPPNDGGIALGQIVAARLTT